MGLNVMVNRRTSVANRELRVGQQLQRTDGAGLVFEVVEPVPSFREPHYRVRRLDDPTDMRVFALSALMDPHVFRPIEDAAPRPRRSHGQLRLSPT